MDRGAWQATVHGVSKSRTQLKTGFEVPNPIIHQVSSQAIVFNLKLEINIYLALVSNQKYTNLRNIWKKPKEGQERNLHVFERPLQR